MSSDQKKEDQVSINKENSVKRQQSTHSGRPTHGLPTPPDGGWGWVVVFGSFMIHVVADGVAYSFGIFVPTFAEYFDVGRSETGWLGSLMIGVTWGSGPIGSILTNKFGCRVTTIMGAVLACVAFVISLFAPNIWFMYFSFGVLAGLGLGMIYLPAIVIVTFYFEKKRAFATGLAVCGSGIGTFIFAPLSQLLLDEYGWKGAVLIVAGLLLNCCVFGALFRPLKADDEQFETESSEEMEMLTMDSKDPSHQQLSKVSNGHTNKEEAKNLSTSATSLPHQVALSNLKPPNAEDGGTVRPFASDMLLHKIDQSKGKQSSSHHSQAVSPLARKDAFYSGSLHNIPLYRSNPALYNQSIASIPRAFDEDDEQTKRCSSCCDVRGMLSHLSLLKDPVYVLFTISNFLTSLGFCVPYIYLPDMAMQQGISPSNAAFLISVIGIANTVGRVVFGWMSDLKCVNRLILYNTALTLCGISTALSAFCYIYPLLIIYSAAFGLFIGVYVGLTSVVLVDLLGLDKLTNAFGLILLFQGAAAVVGPPIAGKIYDVRGSYDDGFYLMGSMIALSGVMLFCIPCVQRFTRNKESMLMDHRDVDMGKKTGDDLDYLPVPEKRDNAC